MPQFSEDLEVLDSENEVSVKLDANNGNIELGNNNVDGDVLINNRNGNRTIHLNGDSGTARLGGAGANGRATFFRAEEANPTHDTKATIYINGDRGNIRLGGNGVDGRMAFFRSKKTGEDLYDYDGQATIQLNGASGDILLANADCAEDFDISDVHEIEPGTVVVIDDDGHLRACAKAYDTRVAGVISGAGACKAALVLDHQPSRKDRRPVALMGKTECLVDASAAPIEVGSLLTTSPLRGYAMRACDPLSAFGAVIGKALRPLTSGKGRIPILIALQ